MKNNNQETHHGPNMPVKGHESMEHVPPHEMTSGPGEMAHETEEAARPQPRSRHTGAGHHDKMLADYRRRFWVSLGLTIPILLLSPQIQEWLGVRESWEFNGSMYVLFGLSTAIFLYGGYPFLKGIVTELRDKSPGMMMLIALAITVAYGYSAAVTFGLEGEVFYWELATLIAVMLLGHWLEMRSVMAASSALEELARLMPSEAHKFMPDMTIKDVPLNELRVNDMVLVKPGEKVPADGRVIYGVTSVNEAMLTGESAPVPKQKDSPIIGGSINGEGSITVLVKKTGEDSYLSQVTKLVRQAQASKSRTQNLADRAALVLVLVALGGGIITLAVWTAIINQTFVFGLSRMVTVMVIACPHALGLAIPLVIAISTSLSARSGILIKERDGFEQARNIGAVLFDKTGTLTLGQFGITDVITYDDSMSNDELLKYAASIEFHSEHPIARGITSAVKETYRVADFKAIPGKGAQGKVNGKQVMAVSPGYLQENGIELINDKAEQLASQGKTVIYVLVDDKPSGAIALADIIRPESRQAVQELKKMTINPMMITGDNRAVAEWVARETGIEVFFAEVLPKKKAEKVKEVQSQGIKIAMTGDGVNDAPALAQADVGIAIGAGTDVAVATADVVLVRSNPMDVVSVIKLSRATYRKMVQNLIWATGYNVIAIPLAAGAAYAAGVLLNPAAGAALMALSTIIVAVNARFLKVKR